MHEMSIVEALLETVQRETHTFANCRVLTVRVQVGQLRQIVPETLQFCFTAAICDTELAGATLEVEAIPGRARCGQCRAEFAIEDNWFQCPHCASTDGELLAGNELNLTGIELGELCPA